MEIKQTGAKYSSIVGIGEEIKELEKTEGKYLLLNRGLNQVENIDLSELNIDLNTNQIQHYPPNSGFDFLKTAINRDYFNGNTDDKNIYVTNGGMSALDLIFKTLKIEKIFTNKFYWGAYLNIMKINKLQHDYYESLDQIEEKLEQYKNNAIIICDPNNPVGDKYDDDKLIEIIRMLDKNNTTIIFDAPYRKLFYSNMFFEKLLEFKNVIVSESFSKHMGITGQRIGFVHSLNKEFNTQLNINLLYSTNGINTFSQLLVHKLLTSYEGVMAVNKFREETTKHIMMNISYLIENNLLVDELYQNSKPIGIFTVIKTDYETLLKNKIGSVPLSFFTQDPYYKDKDYSRICVSVKNESFREYFKNIQ